MINIMKPIKTSDKRPKFSDVYNKNRLTNENIQRFQREEQSRQNESLIGASRFRANK